MRVDQARQSRAKVMELLQYQLDHYLAGGELLPPLGLPLVAEAVDVAAAVQGGGDVEAAVAAAWAAFEEQHPE